MRIGGMEAAKVDELIQTSLDLGIDFYDHADIYGGGKCEEVFAASVARLGIGRDKLVLQSKCGIRKGYFDFSKEHILTSVDGILKRLDTHYIDVLLLHRPDTLVEPEEVAEAFTTLSQSGKVRNFGVSNFNPGQIELLQASLPMKLQANQLQLSITNTGMIDRGLTVNMKHNNSIDRDGGILDYCRLKKITIQAWSPFQYGFFEGVFIDNDKFPELNKVLGDLSEEYGVTKTGLAIAWIQRHPAKIQSVLGTTNPDRVRQVADACKIQLTRPHWYEIYRAAGNILP
ncbi:Oxidoreductase, aldo/keto reductase family [Fimbriimonas ginsengisoli Gsoil 348]|uniref:Oxidoreductase, aldo/keto reductase family n=2 Tax=Fimbriimonas ginsengisoli TaxID=1005039 RepID=A0A068NSV8_FIMGI|nr:Oxidoreductase, aldo/keto reductase family [Fimbriimonas ginsengisoli Gsoil 348]